MSVKNWKIRFCKFQYPVAIFLFALITVFMPLSANNKLHNSVIQSTRTPNPNDYFGVLPTFEKLMQDNDECALPCWWGFELGKASEEDWYKFLHQQGFDKIRDDAPKRQHGTIGGETYFLSFGTGNELNQLGFAFQKKGILTYIHMTLWNPNKWLSPKVSSITFPGLLAQLDAINQTPEIYVYLGGTSSSFALPFLVIANDVGVIANYTFNIYDTLPSPNDLSQWRYCLSLDQTTRIEITVQDPNTNPIINANKHQTESKESSKWVHLEDWVTPMNTTDVIKFFIENPNSCYVPNNLKPEATKTS